jgi:hypothetical protein
MLTGLANGVASYVLENGDDVDGALRAARRMLTVFENDESPLLRALGHSRVGELCLLLDRGEEARHHLEATLLGLEELGTFPSVIRVRWAMVLANLRCGDVDEAEHWLEVAVRGGEDDAAGMVVTDVAARAEIMFARGDVEAGLRSWRRAADRLRHTERPSFTSYPPGLDPWVLTVEAVTVVAHAQHAALDLVEEIAGELPEALRRKLVNAQPSASFTDIPLCGALLLALAMIDIDRGATSSGARMIALAERFRFARDFQPTMSADRARHAAEQADKPAYDDAVSSYADLDGDALRAAALAALRARDRVTARDRA